MSYTVVYYSRCSVFLTRANGTFRPHVMIGTRIGEHFLNVDSHAIFSPRIPCSSMRSGMDQHGANFGLTNRIVAQVGRGSATLSGFAYESPR
jgi:hypothetical protein